MDIQFRRGKFPETSRTNFKESTTQTRIPTHAWWKIRLHFWLFDSTCHGSFFRSVTPKALKISTYLYRDLALKSHVPVSRPQKIALCMAVSANKGPTKHARRYLAIYTVLYIYAGLIWE